MKFNSTVLGIVLLALVGAGVFWARSRPLSPLAGHPPTASARQGEGDDVLPDVTLADGTADVGEVRITFSVTPNPPVALAGFGVRVRAEGNASPAAIEAGRVSFEMAMPMGDHHYTLVPGEEGWQEAAVVLPT